MADRSFLNMLGWVANPRCRRLLRHICVSLQSYPMVYTTTVLIIAYLQFLGENLA